MTLPTLVLAPALAAVLLVVAWLLARLFREWRRREETGGAPEKGDDEIALDLAKERVLITLKDLEFDHEMGKISSEDYAQLKAHYEAEAVVVIEQLDKL